MNTYGTLRKAIEQSPGQNLIHMKEAIKQSQDQNLVYIRDAIKKSLGLILIRKWKTVLRDMKPLEIFLLVA